MTGRLLRRPCHATARRAPARLTLGRGVVRTPAFMPVGTAGTVKAMTMAEVKALGADIILGNTYHLMLRPGRRAGRPARRAARVFALAGADPHRFGRLSGHVAGGAAQARRGRRHLPEPYRRLEASPDAGTLGRDPDLARQRHDHAARRMRQAAGRRAPTSNAPCACRSTGPSARSGPSDSQPGKAMFGIVQGGDMKDLRIASAQALAAMDFTGYAIGGLAVGEPQAVMLDMIETVEPHLPADKPRYLMGVGTPDDLVESVARGIDMFDCVMPTRAGRHGLAYTRYGKINLRNARHARGSAPARRGVALAGGARLQPCLSAPSDTVGRDPRHDAADLDQPRLLSGADGGPARRDRGRPVLGRMSPR